MKDENPFAWVTIENLGRSMPPILGPLNDGHYIQADFQIAQRRANETRKIQFLAVDLLGRPLHGTREELLSNPNCAAGIAWIVPE